MIYDSHVHLDLMEHMTSIVQEWRNTDVGILAVGTTPRAYLKEIEMYDKAKSIRVALGLHPQLVGSGYDDYKLFELLARQCHYIGEVGLDFGKDYVATKRQQIEIFEKIVLCCEKYGNKVVSIHSLKSAADILEILSEFKQGNKNTYILHWFTGSFAQMKRALTFGCYFSINPKMLKTKSGIELIQNIPPERILLETDAPFSVKFQNVRQLNVILQRLVDDISNIKGVDMKKHINCNEEVVFKYL